jgi:hypothetical protein
LYYYRSVRQGDRVRKEYCGGGMLGQVAAQLAEIERLRKEEAATYWREERECLEESTAFLCELEEATNILTRALLLASGCHKHKGEWRRLRESTRTD